MDNLLVVVSGPSGGGKGTIINKVLSRNPNQTQRISTFTTRPKRVNEKDEEQYHFIDQDFFDKLNSQGVVMAKNVVDGYSYRGTNIRYG